MAEASNQLGPRRTRRKPTRRSTVWNHFTDFKDDEGNAKARCKRCQQVLGASTRNGTSTLWAHVRICWGDEAVAAAAAAAGHEHSQSQTGLQDKNGSGDLARMIALHGYDPSFVEDDYFRSFVRKLNPEFQVPSRVAIEEMCDGICDEARRGLRDRLRRASGGRFSFALGKTKTLEAAGEVRYIACHFIDDEWKLHKLVADAFLPEGRHAMEDGPILGFDVVAYVDAYVNDFILDHGYRLFRVVSDWDISSNLEECILINTSTYVDHVLHSIARCILPDSQFPDIVYEDMLELKLTRQERLQLLLELDLNYQWAYDQHWCASYYSFEVLAKRGNDFGDRELFVKVLCKVWKQVYRGIQKISASTCPTSNLCLAELLKLREVLQHELAQFSGDDADGALREASDALDKAIQDSYLFWSVPLAMDPRYKLNYIEFRFKRAFGSSEAATYLSEIKTKINNLYQEYGAAHSDGTNAMMATTSTDPLDQEWIQQCTSQHVMVTQGNSFPGTQTELDRYLQDPVEPQTEDLDILKRWKDNSWNYPTVARMARDALAMPTCSKLSFDQLAQVKSIIHGYSKKPY